MPPLSSATESTSSSLGAKLAESIARRDFAQVTELLHPAVEFCALTPRRVWEPANRDEVLDVLATWFGDADIQDILFVDTDELGGRFHVAYRYQGERPDDPFLMEQQAYYEETDGQISWIRLLCSGYQRLQRRAERAPAPAVCSPRPPSACPSTTRRLTMSSSR